MPLHPEIETAICNGNIDVLELFVSAGEGITDTNAFDQNVLHLAASHQTENSIRIIALIKTTVGAERYERFLAFYDNDGNTPLDIAANEDLQRALIGDELGFATASGAGGRSAQASTEESDAALAAFLAEQYGGGGGGGDSGEPAPDPSLDANFAAFLAREEEGGGAFLPHYHAAMMAPSHANADRELALAIAGDALPTMPAWLTEAIPEDFAKSKQIIVAIVAKVVPILASEANVHNYTSGDNSLMPELDQLCAIMDRLHAAYGIADRTMSMPDMQSQMLPFTDGIEPAAAANAIATIAALCAGPSVDAETGRNPTEILSRVWNLAKALNAEDLVLTNLSHNIADGGGCIPGAIIRLIHPALELSHRANYFIANKDHLLPRATAIYAPRAIA